MQNPFMAMTGGGDGPVAVYRTVMIARPVRIAAGLTAAALVGWLFLKRK